MQKDMNNATVTFRNFANPPKIKPILNSDCFILKFQSFFLFCVNINIIIIL